MDHNELILQAKSGNRPALTQLLMEYRSMVASVTTRYVGDIESRKDVVQNIFIKVINEIQTFANRCRFTTWLYRIAVNECLEHGRRTCRVKERSKPFEDDAPIAIDPNTPDGFATVSSSELRNTVRGILKTIPIDQKTAFMLFYFGGYSGSEAAEALSISEANFFIKLKNARDKVKQGLIAKGWTV